MASARLSVLVGAMVLPACSPNALPEPAEPPAGGAEVRPPPTALPAAAWEPVYSARHGLELSLPARSDWAVNDSQEAWFVAQHPASRSELRLRAWRAPRANTPEACLHQARLWRPDLPQPLPAATIEQRPLAAPEGYRGSVWVGVTEVGAAIEGNAVAVGARTGRCFLLWYRTRIRGDAAEDVVAENLAVVSAGVVDRVRERGIEDAVERESGGR